MHARLIIDPEDILARINPHLYGHFTEHLGWCIYDGIWVGEDSPIPNTFGFRKDVIEALKKMKPSIIRWPGGCFADDYHWQDGIGPHGDRPRRINIHWGEVIETNQVGTQEFVRFCRLVGAEPYICGNVGSGSPREMRDWVEYCNFPGDSTYARWRARDGNPSPLNVIYWSVGNENWGCGGNFSPEDYCTEFRRFASFLRGFGLRLYVIACGPSGNDVEWTDRFFRKLRKDYWDFNNIHGFAAHYYCGTAGAATEYTPDEWYTLLGKGLEMEKLVVQQRAALDVFDPARNIGLIVDEWGTWHKVIEGTNPSFLYQQNTIRDAIVAANTLDIFNHHADKVVIGNIAQMVNVLQSMVLTKGEQMLVTPTGYVYEMYAPHQGANAVRGRLETETISYKKGSQDVSLPVVAGSVSVRGKTLFLTLTNSHASQEAAVQVTIQGGAKVTSERTHLLHGEIHAHNTFDQPETVKPQVYRLGASGSLFNMTLPPASIIATEIELQ
jgi:alpha-L-arabinofuranosidase